MKSRPPGVEPEPILCPACLAERRAQRVWLDPKTLNLICPVHDAVFSAQYLER